MDVLTSETCWAVNWHNKASVIKVGLPLFRYQDNAWSNTHKLQFIFLNEISSVEGVGSFLSVGSVNFYHVSGIICGATCFNCNVLFTSVVLRRAYWDVTRESDSNAADLRVFSFSLQCEVHSEISAFCACACACMPFFPSEGWRESVNNEEHALLFPCCLTDEICLHEKRDIMKPVHLCPIVLKEHLF